MVQQNNLVGNEPNPEDQPAPGSEEDWARHTEEQLLGKEGQEPPPGDEKEEPDLSDVPLEVLQKHPLVQDLQSRFDRQGNVNKFLSDQMTQMREVLKKVRSAEAEQVIGQLGDTPEARSLIERLSNLDEREANLSLREQTLAPIQKQQSCSDIMKDYGIPETSPDGTVNYRNILMESRNVTEMEIQGQTLKKLLAIMPKVPQAKAGGKGTTPGPAGKGQQRQPAFTHTPDKAQGSVAPASFEQAENDYVLGKINWQQYQEAARKAGVKLQ